MKNIIVLVFVAFVLCWSIPKPMESIENYNVLMIHGAYGQEEGFVEDAEMESDNDAINYQPSAYDASGYLGKATLGGYGNESRITKWLSDYVFEEPSDDAYRNARHSYIYVWRSFANPANSSHNNAFELGDRRWSLQGTNYKKRRALTEEAQEVKAKIYSQQEIGDSVVVDSTVGQAALEIMRQNPDLYRQLASRYILIGHSMGGVASREYVQGNFYNGDVDKIITLDSPHEGTGALNMQIKNEARGDLIYDQMASTLATGVTTMGLTAVPLLLFCKTETCYNTGLLLGLVGATALNVADRLTIPIAPQTYFETDPLVRYVDPNQKGFNTIDSLNHLPYMADSLPMMRILASEHGMTFTDPDEVLDNAFLSIVFSLIPDNIAFAFANLGSQFLGTGDLNVRLVNAIVSAVVGVLGIPMTENGSSLVTEESGYGVNVDVLNDPSMDIKKHRFNAAPWASDWVGGIGVTLGTLSISYLAMDALFSTVFGAAYAASQAAKIVSAVSFWASIPSIAGIAFAGFMDIVDSHGVPLEYGRLSKMKAAKNSFTPIGNGTSSHTPYLMEDFLYERPFVNLALSDSRTMGLLAQDSSLNPNCYFESDSMQNAPLCEVGLYGSRDSIVVDTLVVKDTTGTGKDSVRYDTTHIYNAVAERLDSIGNVVRDSLGNVVYDSVYYGSFEKRKYSEFRSSPLKFKSESDWYKVGVKVDRWERVDGLKPNGDPAPKGVPIRHVERYSVPDIVVDGFIEKYSFVVDDLMPHRMRQIKMTFNSNEEVAWECDITKAENDPHACAVYKRLLGNAWKPIFVKDTVVVTDSTGKPKKEIIDVAMKVPHPIKKNGRFDFDARKYFGNLASIQKDNQNTVLISMVNKIGLSNTQRFYYLFKATANMLKPTWPQHDVVLNAIDGFGVYVSALDYQGFRVRSAKDGIFSDPLGTPTQVGDSLPMVMTLDSSGSSAVFASKQKISAPAEGAYRWVVDAVVNNNEKDSSKTDSYEVHFKVDRTAPAFTLTSDEMMNPDSSMFITRFKWVGRDSVDRAKGSDIRVMRWTLEKANGQPSGGSHVTFTKYAELPALYDVASNEFAIAWDKVPQGKRDSMESGLYRIAAYAIDYAVPNLDAYHKVNALVDGIFSNPQDTSVWGGIDSLRLNDTTIYAEFRVDHSAPSFTFRETRAVTAADTVNYGTYVNLSGKYDALRASRPARNADWTYISKDSLLQIGYTVLDTLNGLDSAAVTVGWNFVHILDTNVIDRAGDSVWVFDSLGGKSSGTWTEMAGLRMADGEYSVRAVLRDAAKNVHYDSVPKRVRVDRTAPQIIGLTSDHLVYMDKDGAFSATILLSENADIGVNRTGMHCSYRILGGSDTSWHEIRKGERKLLANDTVTFTIDKSAINTSRGSRYLEAACVDAAGNVSVRTDLFHVGTRFPQITYPQPDSIQSEQSFIPIVGIAPKASSADSLSSVYRLRYRVGNDTAWRTDKVKVVAANRSTSADNISRMSQGTEGVLGYLENDGFGDEAKITVELAIASCETCDDWASVTTNFVVVPHDTNYSKPTVEFAVTRNGADVGTFKTGDGPVDISVRLKNKFNGNYMLRVYAEDSKHRGIFDTSREKVFYNSYYGTPTAAADTAIWFYELDGKYYLKWKNLDKINLKVGYNSAKFGETCVGSAGSMDASDCSTDRSLVDFSSILDVSKAYLSDYPEWMPPAYIDSAMTITKDSGEVVLESSEAFRVYVERKDATDTAALNIPVYFGESDKAGFYWIAGVDTTVSPLMTGWTVNPNAYGLDYRWNGIATSGAYPSGDITLYAEVTENVLDNPFVNVVSKTLKVEQKDVELVAPKSLPVYIALKVVEPNAVVMDDSNKVAYMRDSMKVFFGLKNGDTHVKISVLDSIKKSFRTLLDTTLSAHTGDSAYFVTWDGKDSSGNVQSVGTYYIRFESPSNAFKTVTVPFEMKLRNGLLDETPRDPKTSNLGFYVAEAKKVADDVYRYEPYADYIVMANMSGWYLPDSLRNKTYNVTGNVSGTQDILGFRPERFSLGIKRHRDTLEMVIIRLVHSNTKKIDCGLFGSLFEDDNCDNPSTPHDHVRPIDTVKFWGSQRVYENFDVVHYDDSGFYNPSGDSTYIDIIACTMKTWNVYNMEKKRNPYNSLGKSEFEDLKKLCEWKLEYLTGRERFQFEKPSDTLNPLGVHDVRLLSSDTSVGCGVVMKDGYMESVCTTDNEKYNPNKSLFNVKLVPAKNGWFFTVFDKINKRESNKYWQNINYEYHLEIPESYWNAPFGMDNLVNRTIRFDHTNETIFNENDIDGYWNAVKKLPNSDRITGYFDGNKWGLNPKYGMLTPYEMQHLIFFYVDILEEANAFNFDDESKDFMYSSSFELKFYGKDTSTHHFEAKVIGDLANPLDTSGCVTDSSKFVMKTGASHPCQIRVTSEDQGLVKTPVFKHGNVHFFVGMNRLWSETDNGHRTTIPYPADSAAWKSTIDDSCSDTLGWESYKKIAEGKDSCYRYYGSGSKVHYYFKDYGNNDSLWKYFFLTDSTHYFRNYVNSPSKYVTPASVDNFILGLRNTAKGKDFVLSYNINPDDFSMDIRDSLLGKFFIRLDSLKKIKEEYAGAGVDILHVNVDSLILDRNAVYDSSAMMLYVNAQRWIDTVVYRRSNDTTKTVLERPGDTLSLRDIYVYRPNTDANSCSKALYCVADLEHPQSLIRNPWIKNPVVESASIRQIDFSSHPVLEISGNRDSLDRIISFKDTIVARPPELVEIRGRLTPEQTYSLSYLNNSTYYSITDTLKVDSNCNRYMDGSCHLAWFNVNKLQGHTQFLLTWGGDVNGSSAYPTNAMHFNMYVGSNVKPENNGVVKSMFGDLSVTFPEGSIDKAEDFTVRTVNVQKDYGFGVFKNMALTGPVMEVLPSMMFSDTNNLPRIQMRISKKEMEDMHVTPQTLRLYKVDFDRKEFVPLENALYGFLDAQGAPVMDLNGTDTLKCRSAGETNARCTDEKLAWEYVLISAETRTFSVFVAMDSLAASMPRMGLEVLPAVAKSSEREVRVDGVNDFNLYVDDDSLWNDDDLTPMEPLSFTLDMNGVAHVTLPNRLGEIDTNYVFAFAKVNDKEMFAPVVAKALTVPARFACRVPADSLWMGTDNGYLAYGAICNHPGNGILSLYMDNSLIAEIHGEIPDTIKYDGWRLVGGSMVGRVPNGRYETRYVGFSELGENLQLAGPVVRTDSARPVINAFEVFGGEDILDRVFTVRANVKDVESGIASVVVSSKLGNTSRVPLLLQPDSLGNVTGVIRLSRSELAKCNSCKLSLEMRAEDYGHNHTERAYESEKLYQYPTELALWYPSREGSGMLAYEYVGTGHHLNLDSVKSPWMGDAGIYFSMPTDRAVGVGSNAGRVNLGTSNSYSFETRIKVGYSGAAGWRRVLGFKGDDGHEMELLVNGRRLQLRDGTRVWETSNNVLPVAKEWAHVVVTIDSLEVNFYVNGEIVKSSASIPQERKLDGVFSVGADNENSFIGNIADVRMYKKALTGAEVFVLSLPIPDEKDPEHEIIEIVTVPMVTVDGGDGFEPEFSCSVAGNRYFESDKDGAKLTMDARIEKAGTYKVMMYVRSALLKSANVAVLPSAGVRYAGSVALSPVWRTAAVSGISMNLSAGMHKITLEAPEGLQVAGFALVTTNVTASSIAWNAGLENPERKVKTFVRYEGFDDKKVLQPRVRLKNISGSQINGYSVRYYFRGEESSMAKVHAYYPYDTIGLALHSESARTGFAEWKFENGIIPAYGMVFNGNGPHFGVHYEDWTPWNPYDDPSFVENAARDFVEDDGIIVLDANKRLIGGSCVEMEDSVSAEVRAKVFAIETRNDNSASEFHVKVENVGNVTLKNYDVRYYFFLEGGLAPQFDSYVLPEGVSASLENIGEGRWQVSLHASRPLVSGGSWKDNAQIVLHCENWNDVWNAADDPSRVGLGREIVEAVGVNIFDSLGNRIYGNEPVWPEIVHVATADSSGVPDYGLKPKDDAIPIHRTDDGLIIELLQYADISLSLVNAVGVPVKNLYSGTIASGEQFIRVDWTGIDLNRTYLMLRVNGRIKSTKLLSLL